MKKLKLVVLCASISLGMVPLWALCVQASPTKCPSYMAVACSGKAIRGQTIVAQDYAIAEVFDKNGLMVDEQSTSCYVADFLDPIEYLPF
ncbi:MAG: hypothetical protein QNK37_03165 [Acidobacteriota bacterium]|nr:hypothetical protein [Acidobacteriota bacterium]